MGKPVVPIQTPVGANIMSKMPAYHTRHKPHFTYKLMAATTLLILFVLFLISFSPRSSFLNPKSSIFHLPSSIFNRTARVPEPNERTEGKATVPNAAIEPIPGSSGKTRIFTLGAQDSRLSVNQIIVYHGDIVRIQFSAYDDDVYDIIFPTLGISQVVRNGETKIVEFQATSIGSFDFTCSKCKTKGTLVVVPKA